MATSDIDSEPWDRDAAIKMWRGVATTCSVQKDDIYGDSVLLQWRGYTLGTLYGTGLTCTFNETVDITGNRKGCSYLVTKKLMEASIEFGHFCGLAYKLETVVRTWPTVRVDNSNNLELMVGSGHYAQIVREMDGIRYRRVVSATKGSERWEYCDLDTLFKYTESINGQIEDIDWRKLEREIDSLLTLD